MPWWFLSVLFMFIKHNLFFHILVAHWQTFHPVFPNPFTSPPSSISEQPVYPIPLTFSKLPLPLSRYPCPFLSQHPLSISWSRPHQLYYKVMSFFVWDCAPGTACRLTPSWRGWDKAQKASDPINHKIRLALVWNTHAAFVVAINPLYI